MPDAQPTRVARLDLEYREFHDGHVWLAGVTVLIDGEQPLARGGEYVGLPPVELAAQSALVDPTKSPREVLLYRCSCGESGCGAVVARCYRVDDDVIWDLFDSGNPPPVVLDAPSPALDALVFSAEVYERFTTRVRQLASRHS